MKADPIRKFLYEQLLVYRYSTGKAKHYFEGKAKSAHCIASDLYHWQIREGSFNKMYYAFGLNLAGSRQSVFMGKREFLRIKGQVEDFLKKRAGCGEIDYDVVTKDKFYTNSILRSNNIPCAENQGLLSNGILLLSDGSKEGIQCLFDRKEPFILKNNVLEAGEGVHICTPTDGNLLFDDKVLDPDTFLQRTRNHKWIIQHKLKSSDAIRKINSSALNTTRIVTILNGTAPEFLAGFQAFATNNAATDSWSLGSVYVGFDLESESLDEWGFCNLDDKDKAVITSHPDSSVIFKGYKIPGLRDAVNLCLRAHHLFYFNFIIGWDVAITDEGPVIMEANEKPGMNVIQCIHGGLRKTIRDLAGKILIDS